MALRIGSIKTVHIRKKDIDISVDDSGYQGGKIVIVTNLELINSDNVVFIDNRNDAPFKQFWKVLRELA